MVWRVFIFCFLTAMGAGGLARAEDWPVRGEVSGELKIAALAELGLKWRLESTSSGLVARATRPGLDLEVLARMAEGGAWSWKIVRGAIDLTEAWPLFRGLLGPDAAGWSASGRIELAGDGAWSSEAGPTGEVRVTLREGWAKSEELELEASGIELDAATTDLAGQALPAGQALRVAKLNKAGVEIRDVRIAFGLDAAQILRVSGVEAALFGGRISLKPFHVSLAKPQVEAAAQVEAIELGEMARLMPWMVQAAEGRLRGRVELSWDEEKGLRVRDGGLAIVKSDDAAFRLAPSPGLLTGNMTDMLVSVFPNASDWRRGIGLKNPAYAPLKDIELGREGLRIETFQVTFWPDGQGQGRTATIHIVGRPTGGKLIKEVVMDVNFNGPWSEFLAFGLNQDFDRLNFRME